MSDNININNLQDEIIQKKILYKVEKVLNKFSAQYFKLYMNPKENDSQMIKSINNMSDDLEHLEYQNFKYSAALRSIASDQKNNENELAATQIQINTTKKQIESMKQTLKQQQIIKRNKEQFNQIAAQIKKYDKKSDMDNKIDQIEKEIENINKSHEQQMNQINQQEQYLRTMLASLSCLIKLNRQQQLSNGI